MKDFRMGRNTTEHYSSFEECAKAFGCKPVVKKTKDENKLKSQREKFSAKHKCKACGQPMSWVGGSIMTCTNDKCKGIKVERDGADGNKIISYMVSYDLLDDLGSTIAQNLFT